MPAQATSVRHMSPAVGIDLGTTYSCVGHSRKNKVQIIENDQGNRITPSFVAFTEKDTIVGDAAMQQSAMNPKNTIYDAKRLLGRNFDDPQVKEDCKHYSFKVIEQECEPIFEVEHRGKTAHFSPRQISSMILAKMKQTAEASLGTTVEDAVVTVPAYFSNKQREMTKKAAELAGIHVLEILNEPTAAALAYSEDLKAHVKHILIFDLGGGTFDVSLVNYERSNLKVLATGGDIHLGGEDFDNRLVAHFLEDFKQNHGVDLSSNYRAMRRLRAACERTKRKLSFAEEATIEIDCLSGDVDLYTTITRSKFESLCKDLFESTLFQVEQVLKDTNLSKSQVDEIVLVGGSTRIPKVRELLKDLFNGKSLNTSVNPDEAVAYGAAIRAANLTLDPTDVTEQMKIQDVCSISIGTEILGGIITVAIPRNTPIPTTKTLDSFTTSANYQTSATFKLYEGERPLAKYNKLLGSFSIDGFPSLPAGQVKIQLRLELNSSGILTLEASSLKDPTNSAKTTITGVNDPTAYDNAAEIFSKDAEKHKEEDEKEVERMRAFSRIYSTLQSLDLAMEKYPDSKCTDKAGMARKLVEAKDWLAAEKDKASYEAFVQKRDELVESGQECFRGNWFLPFSSLLF